MLELLIAAALDELTGGVKLALLAWLLLVGELLVLVTLLVGTASLDEDTVES